ncbi:unnamed protein product, partial [Allacma fusca]
MIRRRSLIPRKSG